MTDSEESQSITFTKTFEDYKSAQRLHGKWSARIWLLMGVASLIMLTAGLGAERLPKPLIPLASISAYAFFGGWIGGAVARFVISPMSWKRTFETSKLLHSASTYEWNSKEFRTSNQFGGGAIPWASFFKIKRNEEIILLYVARNQFLVIPRRAFGNEADFIALGDLAARSIATNSA